MERYNIRRATMFQKHNPLKILFLILVLVSLALACGTGPTATPDKATAPHTSETPEPQPSATSPQTKPTATRLKLARRAFVLNLPTLHVVFDVPPAKRAGRLRGGESPSRIPSAQHNRQKQRIQPRRRSEAIESENGASLLAVLASEEGRTTTRRHHGSQNITNHKDTKALSQDKSHHNSVVSSCLSG